MPLHGGFSLSAQTLDNGACPEDLLFVKRCTWRIAAVAHCFDRLIDLAERSYRHGGILPPLGEQHQGEALVAKSSRPIERVPLAGAFLQRLAISNDCLFQPCRSTLALPKAPEGEPQIVLRLSPGERYPLPGLLLQRLAIDRNRIFELRSIALTPPETE